MSASSPIGRDAQGTPGEAFLTDTPLLRSHAGTQPDLFLRWNAVPRGAEAIDVVVHLHGFSRQRGEMQLVEKIGRSGLDLSGRTRPTLALLPRGNWIRSTWYDFPALLGGGLDGGLDALIAYGLDRFGGGLKLDRLILTGHSGGVMPAVAAVAGARRLPDELHLFDGLYGRDPELGDPFAEDIATLDRWLAARFAAEPERPGALRVVYVERQTGEMSRLVQGLIDSRLASADPAQAAHLARRYRIDRSAVPHGYVAWRCGPDFLADPGIVIDWSKPV